MTRRTLLSAAALLTLATLPLRAITLPVAEDTSSSAINGRLTPLTGAATALAASPAQAAFVRFDLSKLPANVNAANITSATLRLYVVSARTGTTGVGAFTVTSDWHETGVTTFPSSDANSGVLITDTPVGKTFISANVTAAIQSALGSGPNFGFLVSTNAGRIILGSKEGPGTGYAAELDVEVNEAVDSFGDTIVAGNAFIGGTDSQLNVNTPGFPNVTAAIQGRSAADLQLVTLDETGAATMKVGAFGLEVSVGTAFKPGGGSFAVLSDARLKHDVEPLSGALDQLLRLRSVTYKYNDPSAEQQSEGRQTGFVAQEVERVFPDWVGEKSDGCKFIAVKGFESLTVQALRELRLEKDAQIEKLRAENAVLAGKLATLEARDQAREARLARLEKALDNRPVRTVRTSLNLQ